VRDVQELVIKYTDEDVYIGPETGLKLYPVPVLREFLTRNKPDLYSKFTSNMTRGVYNTYKAIGILMLLVDDPMAVEVSSLVVRFEYVKEKPKSKVKI
jgi:hypothetical protein